jgi:hypothetical protein
VGNATSTGALARNSNQGGEADLAFAGLNYWAVLVAAIAGFTFGAVYYMALSKPWRAAQGIPADTPPQAPPLGPLIGSFVANLVMAWVLAGMIGHLGVGQVTIKNGVISGAFAWLGFVVTTLSVNYAFGRRTVMLIVIDAAHWLGALVVQGAVIGAFGV